MHAYIHSYLHTYIHTCVYIYTYIYIDIHTLKRTVGAWLTSAMSTSNATALAQV